MYVSDCYAYNSILCDIFGVSPMTYLELCNRVKDKAGVSGPAITDVTAATPKINQMICQFVQEAWIEIQTDPFLSLNFLYKRRQPLVCNPQTETKLYTYEDFSLDAGIQFNYDAFFYKKYSSKQYSGKLKKFGTNEVNVNREVSNDIIGVVSVSLNSFYLYPTNSETIYLNVDYFLPAQILTNNDDLTVGLGFADQMAIVYRALLSYSVYDEATELYASAKERNAYFSQLLYRNYNINTSPKKVLAGNF